MKWQEIRQQYAHQWLLVEAISAHTEGNRRLLEDIAVVSIFTDSASALRRYSILHRAAPERELYVCHTDRPELDIQERYWLGIRGLPDLQEQ